MFSELASIRVDGAKQAALLLNALTPADRSWVLSQLDANQCGELRPLIAELHQLGLPNGLAVLSLDARGQGIGNDDSTQNYSPHPRTGSVAVAEKALLNDADYLKELGSQDLGCLERIWSVEQPELVAYALTIQKWPWHDALLERLPLKQRTRVRDALRLMSHVSLDSKLATAVLARLRKCCEASKQEEFPKASVDIGNRAVVSGTTTTGPLQSLRRGWRRWTAGLRRDVP